MDMKNKKIYLFFILKILLFVIPWNLKAQVDPNIQWREIETENAYWVFNAKHQKVATHFILKFQRAKAEVFPVFKENPGKMTILLVDNTDSANGSAQVVPRPTIMLFLVNPSIRTSIGEFKDPIHELLVHEYTHILNMEPVHGFMAVLGWVFGSVAHPNMTLPRWYTEGLAVYTESLFGSGGRLNSQYLEGLARSLTLEDKWKDYPLSDLNDFHPDWLGGSRAYLFGGILWESIVREKGLSVIYEMNQSYSRRIPYFLDGVLKDHLGRTYEEQLEEAFKFWKERSREQIDKISENSQMSEQEMELGKGQHYTPSISPDGSWMITINNDDQNSGHIRLIPRKTPETTPSDAETSTGDKIIVNQNIFSAEKVIRVVSGSQTQSLNWHPESTGFVYEKLEAYKLYYRFYDLYFYNLKSKKSVRLTHGARAHQSCFAPDGKILYFLQNRASGKNLLAMDWETKTQTVLYQGAIGDDLRSLSCPDGDSLFFAEHKAGFPVHISRWNIKKGKKDSFFNKIPVNFLKFTKKGLLVSSKQSGVENLYLIDRKTKKFKAITNSLTRVVDGDIDPVDGSLYFSQLTSRGLKIFSLRKDQWEKFPQSLPKIKPIMDHSFLKTSDEKNDGYASDDDYKMEDDDKTKNEDEESQEESQKDFISKKFSPWRYLYPNHWIPFVYFVDGGSLYQAITSAGDPLGIHTVSLIGQWDTLTKKPGALVSYLNNSLPVTLGLGVSDFYNFFYSTRSNLHISNARILMSYPVKFLGYTRLLFSWNYSVLGFQGVEFLRQGPQVELSYNNLKRKNSDISYSSGWRFQLGHKNYLPDLSNTVYGETYGHIGSFWSSFTPDRHAFYLGLNGSFAPRLNNGFFAANTLAGPFFNPALINTAFLQRGYPTGLFVARNIFNTNLEYHFPLLSFYTGTTMPPFFLKNLKGAFVFDATTLDGRYSKVDSIFPQAASLGRWFTGYGLELESNVGLGFHLPISLTLGFYYGQEKESFGGFTTFFNIRL